MKFKKYFWTLFFFFKSLNQKKAAGGGARENRRRSKTNKEEEQERRRRSKTGGRRFEINDLPPFYVFWRLWRLLTNGLLVNCSPSGYGHQLVQSNSLWWVSNNMFINICFIDYWTKSSDFYINLFLYLLQNSAN